MGNTGNGSLFNIGYHCSQRQCDDGRGRKNAFTFIDHNYVRSIYTFDDLDKNSNRFANVLTALGFGEKDIVVSFLPKCPEVFFSFLGILKVQSIAGSLFSNFGEQALIDRLADSGAKAVITKKSLYKKVARIREKLPALKYIIITDIAEHLDDSVLSYQKLITNSSDTFNIPDTAPDCPSVLHYTSGSTGKPKGVLH